MENSKILAIFNRKVALYNKIKYKICKKYDISKSSFDIIMTLFNNNDLQTAEDICSFSGLKPSIASVQIDKLIKSGYLVTLTDIKDRRKNILTLTEKSTPLIREGSKIQKFYCEKLMQNINYCDLNTYFKVLEKMLSNINNYNGKFDF